MAHDNRYSDIAANAAVDAVCSLASGGFLRIYSGPRPTGPDAAPGAAALIAECRFPSPGFAPAVGGVAKAINLVADDSARREAVPTWFRVFRVDGKTALWDGEIGSENSDLNFRGSLIVAGAKVEIPEYLYRHVKQWRQA